MPRNYHFRTLFWILSVIIAISWTLFSYGSRLGHPSALEVWVLNVGQGESVLLREPSGHTLLFDGGPSDAVLSELGNVLPPWQRSIDLVILSHNHSDHLRGILGVLERYQVKELWISGAIAKSEEYTTFRSEIQAAQLHPKIVHFEESTCKVQLPCPLPIQFGQLSLQVYHPLHDFTGEEPLDQHSATVMVKASFQQESVLLTGDLNEQQEQEIITDCPPPSCSLAATILQVPHHGSSTGLNPEFLQAIHPQAAFIPVGLGNKFGHPGPSTLLKLRDAHIPTYRTDTQKRIHFLVNPASFQVDTQQ